MQLILNDNAPDFETTSGLLSGTISNDVSRSSVSLRQQLDQVIKILRCNRTKINRREDHATLFSQRARARARNIAVQNASSFARSFSFA